VSDSDLKQNKKPVVSKRLIRRLFLFAVIAFVVFEGCLRFLRFSEPSLFYRYDHSRGIALRPWAEGWWHSEATNYVRISSAGLHDREHAINKPSGTLRIAVLGESYAEAMQVPLVESFWAVAEQRLQQCPGMNHQKIEILNFGVSGYATAQELITLRERVWSYSPDIVLLAFAPGNDVPGNFRPLINDPLRPYFVYRDGQLMLDRSSLDAREASRSYRLRESIPGQGIDWLTRHVRTLQLLTSLRRALAGIGRTRPATRPSPEIRGPIAPANQKPTSEIQPVDPGAPKTVTTQISQQQLFNELGLQGLVFVEPIDENWTQAWQISEALIAQMHKEVRQQNARFYLVTLSSEGQVTPDAKTYNYVLNVAGLNDLFYPERRIRALAEREQFAVLNLAPALKEYAEKNNVYLHGFREELGGGHWNKDGHRVAGELIASWICSEYSR
jgi:hypothetical protein